MKMEMMIEVVIAIVAEIAIAVALEFVIVQQEGGLLSRHQSRQSSRCDTNPMH